MKNTLPYLIILCIASCSSKPEPIAFGKDGCYACKMTIMDSKYGAEVVTNKGKIYKFDDVNCLAGFLHSDFLSKDDINQILIIDFSLPEKLITAEDAFFLYSDRLRSPMASGVAAFGSKKVQDEYNKDLAGKPMTWKETMEKFRYP